MMRGRRRGAALLWAGAWLLGVAALLPAPALAHGGGVPQVSKQQAGGYFLYVWTDPAAPRAGETLHVTVGVTLPGEGDAEIPVTDVAVRVLLEHGEAGAVDVEAKPGAAAGGVFYEADAVMPQAGDWSVRVAVDGAQGAGSVAFVLPVAGGALLPWTWLVAAAVLLLAAAAAFVYTRIAKHQGARRRAPVEQL